MIQANELRIGNWVANVHTGVPVKVLEVLTSSILINTDTLKFTKSYTVPSKAYKGIPLTPEILQQLGFRFSPCGISGADMWQGMPFWSNDDFVLRGNISTAKGGVLRLAGYFNSSVKYLHQLQNLYWCLCGHELEINL